MPDVKDLTVQVATQVDDVMLLLVDLAKVVRAGGAYGVLLDDLVKAIDGVSQIPVEAKQELWAVLRSVANRGLDVAEALVAPKA